MTEVKQATPDATAAEKNQTIFSQESVNYTTLSVQAGEACANCIFFRHSRWDDDDQPCCHIVDGWPKSIEPTGRCDRWEKVPEPNLTQNPIPVVIVEPTVVIEESAEMALPTNRKGFVELIIETVKKNLPGAAPTEEAAFSVFKSASGKKFWLSRHTGKFIDREKEIIADKAHDEYVERVQKGIVPMPELWTWHKKGTKHGEAILVWKSGGFTLALGTFDDTPEGEQAFRFYEKNRGKIKNSHMFYFPPQAKQDGVYHAYNTVEITTLPDGAEAFPYTSFEEILPMTLTESQREFIRSVGGDAMVQRADSADAKAVTDTKTLEQLGVQSKGLENFTGSSIPAAADELKAVKAVQADIETRLKSVEGLTAKVSSLEDQVKTLTTNNQSLTEQVTASQKAETASLEKVNELEKKLTEYTDLKPPSSKSNDTLLVEREKALLEQMVTQAKADNTPSLVEKMVGGQPTVSTGESI